MQVISPNSTQTFFDIALIYYGSVVYATDIANYNDMCITDDLTGIDITLPAIDITAEDKKVIKEIAQLNSGIATKLPK
jgi:hypothetical protein